MPQNKGREMRLLDLLPDYVLERFRDEWLALIRDGQVEGRRWAELYGQVDSLPGQRSVA